MPCCRRLRSRGGTSSTTTTTVLPAGRLCRGKILSPQLLDKLVPYKNILICMAGITFLFALLVVLENILYITANERYAWLLLIPYLLSWILMIIGFFFAHVAYRVIEHSERPNRRERHPYLDSSRAASPTLSLQQLHHQNNNINMIGQSVQMAPYMMCDTGSGPQIFLSSPYMGYAPYPISPFYPPGTPVPNVGQYPGNFGFTPCDLRVPVTPTAPSGPISPVSTTTASETLIVPQQQGPGTAPVPHEPPTYLEAIRGTGPESSVPRDEP